MHAMTGAVVGVVVVGAAEGPVEVRAADPTTADTVVLAVVVAMVEVPMAAAAAAVLLRCLCLDSRRCL
jgi:hypothetical protein